ncbi:MAG TPA: hypothetical protein VGJ20_01855 [Xanthobacteraceae bacterium]
MATSIPGTTVGRGAASGDIGSRPAIRLLRALVIVAGISCGILFVVIGLRCRLQLYADGSLFSYAVAAQDGWAFHWHNISGRLFVYLLTIVPAEILVGLTRNAQGGIVLYGFLFFVSPLLGLFVTWLADGSPNRVIFTFACASTACFCPLVFGFPSEMWVAQAVFWPTLAACHYVCSNIAKSVLIFLMLLALVFSHEGGLILAAVIMVTVLLRGPRSRVFVGTATSLVASLSIWAFVKVALPPDAYDAPVMRSAALHFFDTTIFTAYILVLLFAALAGYGIGFAALRRLRPSTAHIWAGALVAVALSIYWLWFDHALHGEERYYSRTVLLLATAALGALAGLFALEAEGRLKLPVPWLPELIAMLKAERTVRVVTGAFILIMLIHTVETAKFVRTWTDYTAAVRMLATNTMSDPALGDPRFVSSARISPDLNRLSWFSTTPYLSILVAPGLAPTRLVVDPTAAYFWLSCETATASAMADRAVPTQSRRLVRVYACLHR